MKIMVRVGKERRQSRRGSGSNPMAQVIQAALAEPLGMPEEHIRWCADYMIGSTREYLAQARVSEARSQLRAIGRDMIAAYERSGKLCPSAERPVPAKLERILEGPYSAGPGDYDTPAWRCLRFGMSFPQRFQYEVRSYPAEQRFEAIARGSPAGDGKIDQYILEGKIREGRIRLGTVRGRFIRDVEQTPLVPAKPVGLPGWQVGKAVEVKLKVMTGTASPVCQLSGSVGELHCSFAGPAQPHPQAGLPKEDGNLLLPYEVTPELPVVGFSRYVLAAGLWTGLGETAGQEDFTELEVKCRLTIAGTAKGARIRSSADGGWEQGYHPFAGRLSQCSAEVVRDEGPAPPSP